MSRHGALSAQGSASGAIRFILHEAESPFVRVIIVFKVRYGGQVEALPPAPGVRGVIINIFWFIFSGSRPKDDVAVSAFESSMFIFKLRTRLRWFLGSAIPCPSFIEGPLGGLTW